MRLNFRNLTYILILALGCGFLQFADAQNEIFSDGFHDCTFGENWSWRAVGASQGVWEIKAVKGSVDGSCTVSFVDNMSSNGDTTIMELESDWFVAYDYEELNISFDLIFFKNDAQPHTFEVFINYGNGPELVNSYDQHVYEGNNISAFVTQNYKLNITPGSPIQLLFRYTSNGFKSAFVQLDNIKVFGPDLSDCNFAYNIETLGDCIKSNNVGAKFTIDQPSCSSNNSSAMWYQYISEFSGIIKVSTDANFNDAITLYERACDEDFEIACSDRDEFGFNGDVLYARISKGEYYFIRISGVHNDFSVPEGDFCFNIERVNEYPSRPDNDWCTNAVELFVDSLCISGHNINADLDGPLPSKNERSRADIWYYFDYTGDGSDEVIVSTNADFSDVITVYKGNCNQLEETVCNEEGGVALLTDLENGQRYYIQISSYFSTLEGNVCVDLYGFETETPENDSCFQAINVVVDGDCVEASNRGADFDGARASCLLGAESDIWFEFTAPPGGNVVIYPEAEFLYNIAIFHGTCDSLVEDFCETGLNLCEGFLQTSFLTAGVQYFVQISSAYQSSGLVTGDVCLQLFSKDLAPEFTPLSVEVKENCIAGVLSRISLEIKGGKGNLEILGYDSTKLYEVGEKYIISVKDENGCIVIQENVVGCEEQTDCQNNDLAITVNPACQVDSFGLNTGFVEFDYTVENSQGSLLSFGTEKGTLLKHGDPYKVYVIDLADSCLVILDGNINCPPFDCSASVMTLDMTFNCIDSLLKAELVLDAKDGYGQYTYSGHQNGDLFENGDVVVTTVTDAKGCSVTTTKVVECQFDSCAFANLAAIVNYECLTNKFGNATGYAVISLSHTGGIGQVNYSGLNDGDTLFHEDQFELIATDEWGCTSIIGGEIECEPRTATQDIISGDKISLFPNPTQGDLTVAWELEDLEIQKVLCLSNRGEIVKDFGSQLLHTGSLHCDVEDLAPGLYFIQLQVANELVIKKFIKL